MLIIGDAFQNQTQNFSELLLVRCLCVETNMFGLILQLPLKSHHSFTAFIEWESDGIHWKVDGQLVDFFFVPPEVYQIAVFCLLKEADGCLS